MLESLLELDENLFFWINQGMSNPFFDWLLPIWRDKYTWIPLYAFLIVLSFLKFNWKKALLFIVLLVATVGIADQVSSQWIKKSVQRIRPCNDLEVQQNLNLRVDCGSGYSFTSSHATNHLAIATFVAFALFVGQFWNQVLIYTWAASIGFGQVYVGVHYPVDVIVGSLLGFLIGLGIYWIFQISNNFLFKAIRQA